MKTRKDLQHELNVSAAPIANWVKTGLIPDYPNGAFYYDESTYNALLNCLLHDPGKLRKRANRTQNKSRLTAANPPKNALARQALATLMRLFQESGFSVNAFMLAVSLARLQKQFLVTVQGKTIYSLNSVFSRYLEEWLAQAETDVEPLLQKLSEVEFPAGDDDFLGITYESLRTVADKSASGAYFTPLNLVAGISVPETAALLDPCAGTGSMILGIISRHHQPHNITLRDVDALALRIATVNFVLFFNSPFSLVNTQVHNALAPVTAAESFDIIISNPPYGAALSAEQKKALVAQYPQVGDGIRSKKELTKEIEADLRRGIEAYKKSA